MINRKEISVKEKLSPIDRNERITAIAGGVLFVLIIVELLVTASLDGLVTEHIFVGILLSGPLVVKMSSTGYRFVRYYMREPEFVRSGPPNIILRLLAPFLVLTTILLFISGFGLAFGHDDRLFGPIHSTSVAIWIPLTAVHAYAYIRKVPVLIASDWNRQSKYQVSGRKGRLGINILGLMVGAIAAIIMLPLYAPENGWGHLAFHLPGPLSLGIVVAIIAVLVAIPLLRLTNKAKQLG
jgi:hypothetical protein